MVASEVKPGDASREGDGRDRRTVNDIQRATGEAVSAIGDISAVIREISEIFAAIVSAGEEHGAACGIAAVGTE